MGEIYVYMGLRKAGRGVLKKYEYVKGGEKGGGGVKDLNG